MTADFRFALATVLFLTTTLLGAVRAQAECGNAVVEPPEVCDDGNTDDGDCCSSICEYEPSGLPCRTADLCYAHASAVCDASGSCIPGLIQCGIASDPARVNIRDEAGSKKDRLRWQRMSPNGYADVLAAFGDPSDVTEYKLCIYKTDLLPTVATEILYGLSVPAGTDWIPLKAGGWKYKDSSHPVGEIVKVRVSRKKKAAFLTEGFQARVFAKGGALALPGPADASSYFTLDSATGVAIGLVNSEGLCGFAFFSTYTYYQPKINTPTHFKGRNRPFD